MRRRGAWAIRAASRTDLHPLLEELEPLGRTTEVAVQRGRRSESARIGRMGAPKVAKLCVTALKASLDDIEQAVDSSDVIEKVVARGVRLEKVVFDRVK